MEIYRNPLRVAVVTPETDREADSLHPRESLTLIGHDDAERTLAEAISGGRMPHAWLITGQKGVGKATLVYRAVRTLLGAPSAPGRPLHVMPDHPVTRQVAGLAHPDMLVIRRGVNETSGKPRTEITVDEARKLAAFFSLKPSVPGGHRVAVIDAADELNRNAANAILKTLEEPPEGGVIFLICHVPGRLLPTIRSRCRRLVLDPLNEADVRRVTGPDVDRESITLAHGSGGRAIALAKAGAGTVYRTLSAALSGLPRLPLDQATALADAAGKSDVAFDVFCDLLEDWLVRTAQAGAGLPVSEVEPGESAGMERLARVVGGRRVVEAWDKVREIRGATHGLNLDKAASALEALRYVRRSLAPPQMRAA